MLNNYSVSFPSRYDQLYTLNAFLNDISIECNTQHKLPIIVNITSLNSYGRSIKNLLSKTTSLLLLDICQLDSVLAEYHRSSDGRQHFHRPRLALTQGKVSAKASAKFLSMKKFSKSLASLTTANMVSNLSDDDNLDGDYDHTHNQRNLIKNLNEKRSSSTPLCRIPVQYQSYFELLNENDQPIQPCHKLSDLIISEQDANDSANHVDKWPHAVFLRSSCNAYTKRDTSAILYSTKNDQNSKFASNTDPIYESVADLELQKNLIELNDDMQTLQPGQILTILNVCYAFRRRISDKEIKEQQQPTSPSSSILLSANWMREKSKLLFPKKRRQTINIVNILNENIQSKIIPNKSEPCVECQTQQGDHVYIFLDESGSFSPLNCQTNDSKLNTELNRMDIPSVFKLEDILANFRFPISVRLLDGLNSLDNINSTTILTRDESSRCISTKLRLLMQYNENIVFACPLNLSSQKPQKTSSPCIVIPLSVNADIEIQPCSNMSDVAKTEAFQKLLETCCQVIKQYQTEISLINIPLQQNNNTNKRKPPLCKKRSQSDSNLDEVSKDKFRHSDQQSHSISHSFDDSSSTLYTAYPYRDSSEMLEQNLSPDAKQPSSTSRGSDSHGKINKNQQRRSSADGYNFEDEIYEDVDKLYDYIRSGDMTYDVERIKAKEQVASNSHAIDIPSSTETEQKISPGNNSPGRMMTHRLHPKVNNSTALANSFEMYQCRNEGNVDDDQARALFLAQRQRFKDDSKDSSNVKPTTPMKSLNKH
ncbi:unnamed protein product [Rotaria sp. Silwood2]|nr:unnamed protein product [Rotaria sp. Silwood2]CAF4164669.1 unnamed protein product [Rotaria sp. Silwood2]